MLTYTVGGRFHFNFCRKDQLKDLVAGYVLIFLDPRIKNQALSKA